MTNKIENDGVLTRTVLAIRQISRELKQDRFTSRDIYAIGKQGAILDSRELLWTLKNVEVLMKQLADTHDTIKYDNELFQSGYNAYRLTDQCRQERKQDKPLKPATELLQNYTVQANHIPSLSKNKEAARLRSIADAEEVAGGFPIETGVIVGKLKTIETETIKVVQAGVPEDPEHALLHYLKIANRHTPCHDRSGVLGVAIRKAEKVAYKLIEHIWQIETDLEGYHYRDRDLSAELATWKKRAEIAEETIAEINQIVEEALADKEKKPVDEKDPPFKIGTRVYCTFSEARGDRGTVIDHCRDIDGEKANVHLDNGIETGFCPVNMFAELIEKTP